MSDAGNFSRWSVPPLFRVLALEFNLAVLFCELFIGCIQNSTHDAMYRCRREVLVQNLV